MIKCEHLVKKYMSTTAVSDLSLDIISGNIYALLGPNGSGVWVDVILDGKLSG